MAEGLLRQLGGGDFEVLSAGTEETRVHPLAVQAMKEIGVDISRQTSKTLDRYRGEKFEYVITVCDKANETCPIFPDQPERIHWSFQDPSAATGTEEQKLQVFRKVRDEIAARLRLFQTVAAQSSRLSSSGGNREDRS